MGTSDDTQLLVEIAHLYYDDYLTQDQIAKKYNMSRSLVSKLLTKARTVGIVQIIIHDAGMRPYHVLENQLKSTFKLHDVICVNVDESNQPKKRLGHLAAKYLFRRMYSAKLVAVSSGTTNFALANSFSSPVPFPDVTFVPLSGGLLRNDRDTQANVIAEIFARQCGGDSLQLHAPVVVDSPEAKRILMKQHFIKDVLDNARKADLAIVGLGSSPIYFEMTEAYLHGIDKYTDNVSDLIKGDISFNFFNEHGDLVDCKWNQQLMSLSLDEIKKIPEVIGVAGGDEKVESIYIAIRYRLIDTLITDTTTAKKLLHVSAQQFTKDHVDRI